MEISRATAIVGGLVAMGFLAEANGTLVYDTPGTYLINTTVNDNVQTDNAGAQVIVGTGGVIRGVEPSGPFSGAVRTRSGSLDVVGSGRIIAGLNTNAINMTGSGSVVTLRDRASITGDIYSAVPSYGSESSGQGLFIQDHAVVNGNLVYGNYVRIQDDALILGDVRDQGFTNVNLDMRGGTIAGSVALGGLDGHRIALTGGSILGGVRGFPSFIEMTMSDGYIANGLRTRGNLRGDFRGGQIEGGISIAPDSIGLLSSLNITGGLFDTDAGSWLIEFSDARTYGGSTGFSTLDISGGQFGYANAGNGLFIDEWASFNIYGSDLVYSDGWLTGYLQDGNWFHNQLTFGANWRGTFTIYNVPEPGTWALFAVGLLSMGIARRRREHRG
jgi:hypothetical protein